VETEQRTENKGSFEKMIEEKRARFDEVQISKAVAWILETFKSVISWENEKAIIWFKRFLSNPFYRKAGLTKLPDDWAVKLYMPVESFALQYIEVILDESVPENNKIEAMIEFDEKNGIGAADYLRIFPDWPVDLNEKFDGS